MRVNYNKCELFTTKYDKCSICGKKMQKVIRVMQTVNPFNLNKDGYIKTREEIYKELHIELKEKLKQPLTHKKCMDEN